jgi:predicted amidohydrolase YtcJ
MREVEHMLLGLVLLLATRNLPTGHPHVADLVVVHANVYTAAIARPRAVAMAVMGGRIVAVGDDDEARVWMGPQTQVLDLAGKTVLPGLIDSHGHILNLGSLLRLVDLVGTKSYDEAIARVVVRAKITPKGEWVLGRGWDQNDWPGESFPTEAALSRAVPDHPVRLTRIDGHALLANRMALDLAKVTKDTPDPEGGRIERDASGNPTGVFVDRAKALIENVIPAITPAEREARLLAAMRECARFGLTMVHDAGIGTEERAAYHALIARGTFPIRIYAMARADDALGESLLTRGPQREGDRFEMRAVKAWADGALGSRGALLGAPYTDDPKNYGLLTFPFDRLREVCRRALAKGVQVRVHAIGDSANHATLDAYSAAFGGTPHPGARWTLEHAQIVRPADIRRCARLGVIASMQPTHATSDGPWAEQRLGPERIRWSYAWRQFLNAGAPLASGSDFPVESPNPMLGLYAAITRRDLDGKLPAAGWRPEEKLTPDEALRSFTIGGAYAAFREKDLGTLEVGKLADFIVVDRDVIAGPVAGIPAAQVLRTVIGGKTVFEAKAK